MKRKNRPKKSSQEKKVKIQDQNLFLNCRDVTLIILKYAMSPPLNVTSKLIISNVCETWRELLIEMGMTQLQFCAICLNLEGFFEISSIGSISLFKWAVKQWAVKLHSSNHLDSTKIAFSCFHNAMKTDNLKFFEFLMNTLGLNIINLDLRFWIERERMVIMTSNNKIERHALEMGFTHDNRSALFASSRGNDAMGDRLSRYSIQQPSLSAIYEAITCHGEVTQRSEISEALLRMPDFEEQYSSLEEAEYDFQKLIDLCSDKILLSNCAKKLIKASIGHDCIALYNEYVLPNV